MKKIVIVGGAGFIGHHLALFLNTKDYEVTVIGNPPIFNGQNQ